MKTLKNYQTPHTSILSVVDFHAKTSVLQEREPVSPVAVQDYGMKCTELYGRLDPNTCSLKTAQCSLFEDSNKSYATFPKSGIMRNGNVYRIKSSDFHIIESGSTVSLMTPTKSDGKRYTMKVQSLIRKVGHSKFKEGNLAECLAARFGLKITPSFCEWMMGFPIMYTVLKQ